MAERTPDKRLIAARLDRARTAARTALETLCPDVQDLVLADRFGGRFEVGWTLPVQFSTGPRNLLVLIDGDFPYSLPRAAVDPPPEPLQWPHVEDEGLLCIYPSNATWNPGEPGGVVTSVVGDACRLVEDLASGEFADDFRDEFLSYWSLAIGTGRATDISLVTPEPRNRPVALWRSTTGWYFADTEEALSLWLRRMGKAKPKNGYHIEPCAYLGLEKPLIPSEYPANGAHLRKLVLESGMPLSRLPEPGSSMPILIGFNTVHGSCFASMDLRLGVRSRQGPARSSNSLTAGFRPGKVPKDLLLMRGLTAAVPLTKRDVRRADSAWIHGRDRNPAAKALLDAKVSIIGCGALGSAVAKLLAQTGVGALTLIDGETLEWANVSRHLLGASAVGKNKAEAVAELLERDFPHLRTIAGIPKRFSPTHAELVEELVNSDLVICATGEWSSGRLLEELRLSMREFPPMVVGWLEGHALAGHAVLLNTTTACMHCGWSDSGSPLLTVTDWPEEPVQQIPACGGVFMPFGAIDLMPSGVLCSKLAIEQLLGIADEPVHATWIGPRYRLEENGGTWSTAWLKACGDPGEGNFESRRTWPRSEHCRLCGSAKRVA